MQSVKDNKSVFPAVMLGIGLCSLPFALWLQLRSGTPAELASALLIAMYAVWIATEARVTIASANEIKSQADHGTLQRYGIARLCMMLLALFMPSVWTQLGIWTWLAMLLFFAGVALRLTAIRSLGRFYSHQVRTVTGHRIIQNGPYRWIRHPAYAGMLLAHAGFVLNFCNPASVAAFAILFVPAVISRIRVEEQTLQREVDGYTSYANGRKRLVPLLW